MKIILAPNPLLHEICAPVLPDDSSVKRLAKHMLKLMYKYNGVGLAAPQVGELKRLIVLDTQHGTQDAAGQARAKDPYIMINPEIIDHAEERVTGLEGCLSCPGISVEIERWAWVKVRCLDEDFEECQYFGEDLFGRCMQHEIDHLNGKTLFERLPAKERIHALEAYRAAREAGAGPGDV